MKSVAIPTADEINIAHRAAKSSAEDAIQHAITCGKLLAKAKAKLGRGEFDGWVEKHCDFGRSSAYAYFKVAAKSSRALDDFKSIQQALGYDKKPAARQIPKPDPKPFEAETSPPVVEPDEPLPECAREDWTPDEDEDAQLELAERDYQERIDKVVQSDDVMKEARAQIEQQAALIATLTLARNGFQNARTEILRLLKREQRKTARLEKQIKAAEAEIETLRERVALTDAA